MRYINKKIIIGKFLNNGVYLNDRAVKKKKKNIVSIGREGKKRRKTKNVIIHGIIIANLVADFEE